MEKILKITGHFFSSIQTKLFRGKCWNKKNKLTAKTKSRLKAINFTRILDEVDIAPTAVMKMYLITLKGTIARCFGHT